jgi:hypothetical protein
MNGLQTRFFKFFELKQGLIKKSIPLFHPFFGLLHGVILYALFALIRDGNRYVAFA